MQRANRVIADEFDRELYNLLDRALYLSETGASGHRKTWGEVARALSEARPKVRGMMDARKRAETY